MWPLLILLAVILYLLIPKDTPDERKDNENFIDDMYILGEDEDEDLMYEEELLFLLDEEEEDDDY
jgi:hypothetical protein